jgi:hypothetical protein
MHSASRGYVARAFTQFFNSGANSSSRSSLSSFKYLFFLAPELRQARWH